MLKRYGSLTAKGCVTLVIFYLTWNYPDLISTSHYSTSPLSNLLLPCAGIVYFFIITMIGYVKNPAYHIGKRPLAKGNSLYLKIHNYLATFPTGAKRVIAIWVVTFSLTLLLHANGIISDEALVRWTALLFFADQFCISVWCPFQDLIMRNRCCASCRLDSWGPWMFTAMLLCDPDPARVLLFFSSLLPMLPMERFFWHFPNEGKQAINQPNPCHSCRAKEISCTRKPVRLIKPAQSEPQTGKSFLEVKRSGE